MEATLVKVGNSVNLRLAKHVLQQVKLKAGDRVELTVQRGGRILIAPTRKKPTLEELLKGMNRRNWHPREDWGAPVGKEAW